MPPKTDNPGPPPQLPFRDPLTTEFVSPDWDDDDDEEGSADEDHQDEHQQDEDQQDDDVAMVINGSGGDSSGLGVADTQQVEPRYGLRIMSWNLQDLGGGPSRGPQRADSVIQRIACILFECQPDICAILEVKRRVWMPPKPLTPTPPPRTRGRDGQISQTEFERRQAEFRVKMEEWQQRRDEAQRTDPREAPGIKELDRILAELNRLAGRTVYARMTPEQSLGPEHVFTEGETYGFIYNAEVVDPVHFRLMNQTGSGQPLHWPEPGYRAPAKATFQPRNWPRPVDVVAFHAPAPNHGEITHQAIEKFSQVNWERDTVVAGDFNVDTEADDPGTSEQALDTLLSFYDGACEYWVSIRGRAAGTVGSQQIDESILLSGRFQGWFNREDGTVAFDGDFYGFATRLDASDHPTDRVSSSAQLDFTGAMVQPIESPEAHGDIDVLNRSIEHAHKEALRAALAQEPDDAQSIDDWLNEALPDVERETHSVAAEGERTSLRRKIISDGFDPFNLTSGGYSDGEVFNNAGYDKLFVVPVTPDETIRPIEGWAYPLFERCLPEELCCMFEDLQIAPEAMSSAWNMPLSTDKSQHVQSVQEIQAALEQLNNAGTSTPDDEGSDNDLDYSPTDKEPLVSEPTGAHLALYEGKKHSVGAVQAMLQSVLDQANLISDHIPMILDVELVR